MLPRSAHSPASSTAEAFARKVIASRTVWTMSGEDGLARVPSTSRPGREVTLCWSSAEAAERLGRGMARHARVNPIVLGNFVGTVLPKLRALNRLVAPDWSADPYHPQLEAGQLEHLIKAESTQHVIAAVVARGAVYTLENDIGPAYAASQQGGAKQALAVWTSEDDAASHIKGFWAEMTVAEIPLETFTGKTLPYVAGLGRGVSLDYGMGGVATELGALDLAARLLRGRSGGLVRRANVQR
ncbi:MAG: DUF2750 domain-containing protein [Hyphomicrobiaceae bacterium]